MEIAQKVLAQSGGARAFSSFWTSVLHTLYTLYFNPFPQLVIPRQAS